MLLTRARGGWQAKFASANANSQQGRLSWEHRPLLYSVHSLLATIDFVSYPRSLFTSFFDL